MTEAVPIRIEVIAEEAERPVFAAAVAQLRDCLAGCGIEAAWQIEAHLRPSLAAVSPDAAPAAVIVSLLGEAARTAEAITLTEARWRGQLAALDPSLVPVTFLCTVFRAVPAARAGDGAPAAVALLERIRRLDMLAIDLSHDIGVNVIDLDRVLAHVGGRALGADYRVAGMVAEEVAGYAIVASLLNGALDGLVPAAGLERAKQLHGPLWEIVGLVERRVGARARTHVPG